MIVAESHEGAVFASKKVVVKYERLPGPLIMNIEDAMAQQSYFGPPFNYVESGDHVKSEMESEVSDVI